MRPQAFFSLADFWFVTAVSIELVFLIESSEMPRTFFFCGNIVGVSIGMSETSDIEVQLPVKFFSVPGFLLVAKLFKELTRHLQVIATNGMMEEQAIITTDEFAENDWLHLVVSIYPERYGGELILYLQGDIKGTASVSDESRLISNCLPYGLLVVWELINMKKWLTCSLV